MTSPLPTPSLFNFMNILFYTSPLHALYQLPHSEKNIAKIIGLGFA